MRFRFCWDCDCPEWLLAEMASISKMKSDVLSDLVRLVAQDLSTPSVFDYPQALELTNKASIDESTLRAVVAALRWILESASGSETEPKVLSSELQQLGLPKEHTAILEKVYQETQGNIRASLKDSSLKASSKVKWDMDLKGLPITPSSTEPMAEVTLSGQVVDLQRPLTASGQDKPKQEHKFVMTKDQLDTLIHGLKEAQQQMEELQ